MPQLNLIANKATTIYKYTVEPTIPNFYTGAISTNSVSTKINSARLTATNSANKGLLDIGDKIKYTIYIINKGNVPATKVTLFATIPSCTTFVSNSTVLNRQYVNIGNPNEGFYLETIPIGTTRLHFRAKVISIPEENPILNSWYINYRYTVDPELPNGEEGQVNTETVSSEVYSAIIKGYEYVNTNYADIGDTLTYTVELNNEGNIPAYNLIFRNTLPNGISFIEDSLTLDGVNEIGVDLREGFVIDTVPVGILTITFDALVTTVPSINPVLSHGITEYKYTVDPSLPNGKSGVGKTNNVMTKVNTVFLNTKNTVNKEYADIGDTLIYTISLINTGNVTCNNVVIKETIPKGIKFLDSSVNVRNINYDDVQEALTINLGTIPIGVTTITFRGLVQYIPNPSEIINQGVIYYSYTVNPSRPNEKEKYIITEIANTKIKSVLLDASKYVDKENADEGDVLEYTLNVNNSGNIEAEDVLVLDTIPKGVIFVENSFKINGEDTNIQNIDSIFYVGSLPVGTTTFTYNVLVDTVPKVDLAENSAEIDYKYTVNPEMEKAVSKTICSNSVKTNIKYIDLKSTNTADTKYCDLGEEISYRVVLTNRGNIIAENLVLRSVLQSEVDFITDSLALDGVTIPGENPILGFAIDEINPGESATVTFKVSVNNMPLESAVKNYSQIIYNYTVDPAVINGKSDVSLTNEEFTKINKVYLSIDSKVDKNYAAVGDTLRYTLELENTGTTDAVNVIIKDTIPINTTFVDNSISVNGNSIIGANFNTGFSIATLPIGTTTVMFDVKVDTIPSPNSISNDATVLYSYIVDQSIPSIKSEVVYANTLKTEIYSAFLSSFKYVDKDYANKGETIEYTISIVNYGNVSANNVYVMDVIQDGITFVEDSLKVDGVSIANGYDSNGIKLGIINVGQSTVNFKVKVEAVPSPNPIGKNYSLAYKYTVDSAIPNGYSNKVNNLGEETQVNYIDFSNSMKIVNKPYATCGDELTYTIVIPNTGNVAAENLIISDTVPEGTNFVENSLMVNGISIPGDPTNINIGTIPSGGVATVNFNVIVNCQIG